MKILERPICMEELAIGMSQFMKNIENINIL